MNFKPLLTLCCIALLFASCSHVYTPALYHQDIAYQPKPASFDSVKARNYISGGFNAYSNTFYNDFLVSGQLNLSRGYVFKNFNIAYGAFGVFGDYQNGAISQGQPNYFSDKFFGAVGGRFSANAYVNSDRVDFRFIGVEMAYSHEFGSYANFRQYINTQPNYYVDPRTNLFTIGLTTEVYFHNVGNTGFQHGIRGFLGTTLGYNELSTTYYTSETATDRMFRNIFPKVSYFITFKDFFGTIEAGQNFMLRFGYKF
ncbi:MAG: hypothetical protein JWQ84_159 [Mucilaginibacter sp.]|jgi:hypothetical protein|nr:hypothetical protein [Mucilaginibacter sp.]MDB5139669.1 hypothetical protein [Mucilaginibacter sp.]